MGYNIILFRVLQQQIGNQLKLHYMHIGLLVKLVVALEQWHSRHGVEDPGRAPIKFQNFLIHLSTVSVATATLATLDITIGGLNCNGGHTVHGLMCPPCFNQTASSSYSYHRNYTSESDCPDCWERDINKWYECNKYYLSVDGNELLFVSARAKHVCTNKRITYKIPTGGAESAI